MGIAHFQVRSFSRGHAVTGIYMHRRCAPDTLDVEKVHDNNNVIQQISKNT